MTKVVVLGGGVAGLSAAHELAERGFEVVLIERTGIPGGKARSSPIMPRGPSPWTALERYPSTTPGDKVEWVPGEHGFRFFPGFYKHVVDTMSRIPTPSGISAAEHLVPVSRCGLTQYEKPGFDLPARFPHTPGDVGTVIATLLTAFSPVTGLTHDELAHFGGRIWQILTSCSERRLAEYEKISWWEFIGAESRSGAYKKFLAAGITRSLVAAHAETASARTIGNIFVQLLLDILDPLVATSDRVLDGPTNKVWIYPWLNHVRALGVTYLRETEVQEIRFAGGRITGVVVQGADRKEIVEGDHYICALPAEKVAPLLTPALLRADPALEGIGRLAADNLEWMNGIQYYLRRPVRMVRGHMIHIDSEWALTSISQVDVWAPGTMRNYGPFDIQGIVSVDVSDWDAPAPNGRSATEHSREEVCAEVWRQLKRSVNLSGEEPVLRDEDLYGWFIDSAIDRDPAQPERLANAEPLLVNMTDTWQRRPEAVTAIPNLFLAADYVRTNTDLATMEAANEAARRAVNGVLDAVAFSGSRCEIWPLHEPPVLAPFRQYDALRFGSGLPWDPSLMNLASAAVKNAEPLLAPLSPLIASMQPVASTVQKALEGVEAFLPLDETEKALQPLAHLAQKALESGEAALPLAQLEEAAVQAGRGGAPAAPASGQGAGRGSRRQPDEGPPGFSERLDWYRTLTLAALDDGVPRGEPRDHLYGPIREFVGRPSKGLRAATCLATCRAFGGQVEDALPSAAGIELLHNAFLVHDDIEDGSDFRRGRPTLHRVVGLPLAVNAGDAMNALAMGMFRKNITQLGPEAALRVFEEVDHMLKESLEGQAMEIGWVRDNNCRVATDDYLRLVLKKTAWYSFIHPMRIGALAARPGEDGLDRFDAFGYLLGAAFQIQDDVLNLVGDASLYGKEIGGDLTEGKRTLPLAHAFARGTPAERARLEQFFERPRERGLPRLQYEVRSILERGGSIAWAKEVADALAAAARDALPTAFAGAREGPDLDFIRKTIDYLVRREV